MFAILGTVKKTYPKQLKIALLIIAGLLLGAIIATGARFAIYKPDTVHYHANFALYVNGARDEFKGPAFYEEVESCHAHNTDDPLDRTHMHNRINDVIHVHAHGVTWSQFFSNLGYTLGDTVLVTGRGTYVNGADGNKLSFILNGEPVDSIANKLVGDDDALLINYGKDSSSMVEGRYKAIPHTAHQYDEGQDPSSCAGSEQLTFWKRLKISVGANP